MKRQKNREEDLKKGIHVQKTLTINRPREEVYAYWRDFERLPSFMEHLESVEVIDDKRSHWKAKAPGGSVEWDAEIVEERPNELIRWRSLEGAQVDNSGAVTFAPHARGLATELKVELAYLPPAGKLGASFASFFGEEPSQQIEDDLSHFKNIMETGWAGEGPRDPSSSSGRSGI